MTGSRPAALTLSECDLADRATVADEWAALICQLPAGHAMDGHTVRTVTAWPTAEEAEAHASTLGKGAICVTALPYKLWYLGYDTISLSGEYPTLQLAVAAQANAGVVLRASGPHV